MFTIEIDLCPTLPLRPHRPNKRRVDVDLLSTVVLKGEKFGHSVLRYSLLIILTMTAYERAICANVSPLPRRAMASLRWKSESLALRLRVNRSRKRVTVFEDHCPPVALLIPRRFLSRGLPRRWQIVKLRLNWAHRFGARRPAPPDCPAMIAPNGRCGPLTQNCPGIRFWSSPPQQWPYPSDSPAATAESRRGIVSVREGRRTNKFSAHVSS